MLTGSIFKIGVCLLLAWVSLFPHNNYTICFKGPVVIISICQGFSLLNLKWLILCPYLIIISLDNLRAFSAVMLRIRRWQSSDMTVRAIVPHLWGSETAVKVRTDKATDSQPNRVPLSSCRDAGSGFTLQSGCREGLFLIYQILISVIN